MAALWNGEGHYIFALWFLSSFFYQRPQIGCLPYFHTWCGLCANLECRSEMCCKWLAENTGRKKSPFCHHRTTLSGCIFATKACIDNRKKMINADTSYTCLHDGELRPTNGWDLLASLGHPCKFQRVSRLGSVNARHSSTGRQPNFAALNRGHHLYSARRPSRWALAHILVCCFYRATHMQHMHSVVCATAVYSPRDRLSVDVWIEQLF